MSHRIFAAKLITMDKQEYVYIMTNKNKTTLYIGVTNDLCRRIYEHKNHLIKNSFTDKYNLEYCIYYEEWCYFDLAINREKELKKWNRSKKEGLINAMNPQWKELVNENGFVRDSSLATLVIPNNSPNPRKSLFLPVLNLKPQCLPPPKPP